MSPPAAPSCAIDSLVASSVPLSARSIGATDAPPGSVYVRILRLSRAAPASPARVAATTPGSAAVAVPPPPPPTSVPVPISSVWLCPVPTKTSRLKWLGSVKANEPEAPPPSAPEIAQLDEKIPAHGTGARQFGLWKFDCTETGPSYTRPCHVKVRS